MILDLAVMQEEREIVENRSSAQYRATVNMMASAASIAAQHLLMLERLRILATARFPVTDKMIESAVKGGNALDCKDIARELLTRNYAVGGKKW